MTEEQVGEIRISKRILRVGHQVYPLANISRVQILRVRWGGKLATYYPLQEITILLVLGALAGVVVANLSVSSDDIETVQGFATAATVLVVIRIVYLLCVLYYRLLRRPLYVLTIETAGTQYTALSGTDYNEIYRVEDEIVNAIEDPPSHERIVHVGGDLVIGDKVGRDKIQQSGTDNWMTISR